MQRIFIRSALPLVFFTAAGFGAASTAAQPRGAGSGSTYQQEIAVCDRIQQDRAACIREAGAARQAAARGGLTAAPDYEQNALARCSLQPPSERDECEARVRGTGQTRIDGSVLGGGVIRETVTPITIVPAPVGVRPPAMAPAPVVVPAPAVVPGTAPRPLR